MTSFTRGLGLISTAILAAGVMLAGACSDDEPSGSGGSAGASSSTGGASTVSSSASASSSSSGVGGGSGGGGGEGGAVELIPWEGDTPDLTIAECVNRYTVVTPSPGNEGHLAAVRLTPPQYPFVVTEVVYELSNGALDEGTSVCNSSLAHRVEVFVDTNVTPPATPTLAATINVPAAAATDAPSRLVTQALPAPLTLTAGQHLFVAVEVAGTAEEFVCIWMCAPTGSDDRNYWSNATMAPYNWATLASFQNPNDLRIGANGAPP